MRAFRQSTASRILAAEYTFDGNIHSIAGSYWFDQSINRTVGVNTAIILEALEKVYGADHLLDELTVVN